jgi:hypothetical protein
MDERLNLDKRRDRRAFCVCFESLDEAPEGFYERQDELRDGLEKEFWMAFPEGKEPPQFQWASPTNKWFYFDGDMHGSERIEIELTDNIIGDKLLGVIMAYLEKGATGYCVVGVVYNEEQKGNNYIGRFVLNRDEIAVEKSLAGLWSRQVKFMEIEK